MPASQGKFCLGMWESTQVALLPKIQFRILEHPDKSIISFKGGISQQLGPRRRYKPMVPPEPQQWASCPASWKKERVKSQESPAATASPPGQHSILHGQLLPLRTRTRDCPEQTHPKPGLLRPRSSCRPESPQTAGAWCFQGQLGALPPLLLAAFMAGDCSAMQGEPFDPVCTLSFPKNLCSREIVLFLSVKFKHFLS